MDTFTRHSEAIELILEKLPLRDVVLFHYGCSKESRQLTSSRVFEGEPFFLHYSPLDSNPSYYAFSLQRWVQLLLPTGLPVSCRHLRPVSTSGGLVLFSGVPGCCKVLQLRQRWPLVVVNPITRKNRLLLLLLELPPEFVKDNDTRYPEYYSDLLMGLKVNAASKTYKVVVHWKSNNVVQIFDSGSHQWSTLSAPTELEAYANSSTEIVFCRNYKQGNALRSSVFDIGHGKLVDCRFREDLRAANVIPSGSRFTIRGPTIVGESCLYVLSYNVFPTTYVRIHKRERSSINWQLVTEVPWKDLCLSSKRQESLHDAALSASVLDIYECGKHLLFAVTFYGNWSGALYDLEKQVWNPHFVVKRNPGSRVLHDGLFFQPQLNGPPC